MQVNPNIPIQSSASTTSRLATADDDKIEIARSFMEQRRTSADQRDQAYLSFLKLLTETGALDSLPVDGSGTLRVSAPFCHDFFEGPLLLPLLSERVLDRGLASGIAAFGMDLHPQAFWWSTWEQWISFTLGPRVTLKLRQQDLEKEAPPEADLILGLHPEVTNGGPWPQILKNIMGSCSPGGQCIFATFYRQEAEATASICRGNGFECRVLENPHYAGQAETAVGTFLRFAVVLSRSASRGGQSLAPQVAADVRQLTQPATLQTGQVLQAGKLLQNGQLLQTGQAPVASRHAPAKSQVGDRASVLDSTLKWVEKRRAAPDQRDAAYHSFLQALAAWGVLEALPADAQGGLQVSAPFCQEFFEAPLLLPFLKERLLGPGGVRSVSVWGCDVEPQHFWWPAWQAWTEATHGPKLRLCLRELDLERNLPPAAGLILAVHPEVTKGGPWRSILANVLKSRLPGAQCVFATFYDTEAQEACKVCEGLGARCEVRENPYYAGQPAKGLVGTFLRYIVIVSRT